MKRLCCSHLIYIIIPERVWVDALFRVPFLTNKLYALLYMVYTKNTYELLKLCFNVLALYKYIF